MAHRTVAKEVVHEELIEGSRFIAYVAPVASAEEAEAQLAEARREHPDATHHCWAYRLGEVQRFNDDGEPGGTAGRPMLEVMLKRDLNMLSAVVVRYFGGRKLGAGGLVRAYSGTVAKALDVAGVREVVDMSRATVRAPFPQVDAVLRLVDELVAEHPDSRRGEAEFDGEGLRLELLLPSDQVEEAERRLTETTRGSARLEME